MAQPTNSFSTNDAIGIREDLTDVIYNIDPTETPFMTMIARTSARNTYHEWQTETLDAADATNAHVEGDDTASAAIVPTTRLGNYTQISKKTGRVTNTQNAVNTAGRARELAHQKVKKGKELRRDMESVLLANNARVAGSDVTPRELAGVPAWIATNTDAGSGGSDPTGDGTDARTDGTQEALTEARFKAVLQSIWDNGGNPDCVMVGGFNKQVMSGFAGNSTRFDKGEDKTMYASVDVYVSDFSPNGLKIIPNRFQRARDCLVVQKDMWAVAFLRPIETEEFAPQGDSKSFEVRAEYTLVARNERANGIVADNTTS
jgi:hypothetical protein